MLFLRGGRRVSQQERNGRLMVGFWCLQKACTTVLFFVFWSKKIGASQLLFFVAFRHCHLGTPPPLTPTLPVIMDFVFSNAPSRIVAMTRPMEWAALDEGHEDGAWRMELQNPALEVPQDLFVYGHTGTVAAVTEGHAPKGWRLAWDPLSFDAQHWSTTYGDAMWNHASVRFMTLDEALTQWPEEGWHMRPCGADSGPKAFKGFFSTRAGLDAAWATSRQGRGRNGLTRVAVSSARLPHEEYRLVFMRGVCVEASLYLVDGHLVVQRGAPAHVLD